MGLVDFPLLGTQFTWFKPNGMAIVGLNIFSCRMSGGMNERFLVSEPSLKTSLTTVPWSFNTPHRCEG